MTNRTLRNARKNKKDEFYTQLSDIEKELVNYAGQLVGKTVYCNCDSPESSFVRYFTDNFKSLGLKGLIATHYVAPQTGKKPQKIALTPANNAEGFIRAISELEGDGDFRSEECLELLKASDVVITNPPFSLWREFVELLIAHGKQFLALGTIHAINYKSVLDGIIRNTIRPGYTNYNKTLRFIVPAGYNSRIIDGQGIAEVPSICWWTTLPVSNRKALDLHKTYTPDEYQKYEAKTSKGTPAACAPVDAINIDRVADIPCDYDGLMGVPVTVLGVLDYSQYEVVGKVNNGFIGGRKVYTRILIRRRKIATQISADQTPAIIFVTQAPATEVAETVTSMWVHPVMLYLLLSRQRPRADMRWTAAGCAVLSGQGWGV